jgi:pseudouridine-5'-phosphate glycosidase
MSSVVRIEPEVAEALASATPVVALESTLIAHGLPRGRNLDVARELEAVVRSEGAVPATIAVVAGQARVGLDAAALEDMALGGDFAKAGVRDLAPVMARGESAATTVASTSHLAARAGIRVFATGGLGGVHREARATWDESSDLVTLAATGVTIVCSGVKSILDVGATLERLETLNVCVLGYGTDRFPGFYLADSGFPAPWRVDSPEEVAAVMRIQADLGLERRAIVVANPLPEGEQVDPGLHDRVLSDALAAASAQGVRGGETTPFLLDRFHRDTGGATLEANVALVRRNAELAARIAVAAAGRAGEAPAGAPAIGGESPAGRAPAAGGAS